MKYGDEGQMYRLILRASTKDAEDFQNWITNDVVPSIRKHGAYMTQAAIEKALTDPDFIISLATQLKTEKERAKLLADENKHKEEVIEGLVANISLADMRQRITQIIRKMAYLMQEGRITFYTVSSMPNITLTCIHA